MDIDILLDKNNETTKYVPNEIILFPNASSYFFLA